MGRKSGAWREFSGLWHSYLVFYRYRKSFRKYYNPFYATWLWLSLSRTCRTGHSSPPLKRQVTHRRHCLLGFGRRGWVVPLFTHGSADLGGFHRLGSRTLVVEVTLSSHVDHRHHVEELLWTRFHDEAGAFVPRRGLDEEAVDVETLFGVFGNLFEGELGHLGVQTHVLQRPAAVRATCLLSNSCEETLK